MRNHTLRFENATGSEFAASPKPSGWERGAVTGVLALTPSVGASARCFSGTRGGLRVWRCVWTLWSVCLVGLFSLELR